MRTIEELVTDLTGQLVVERPRLLFELYESYQKLDSKAEPFQDFMLWGGLLLNDFNEVDRFLIEPDQLFTYLADIKRVEHWNLEGPPGPMLERYLRSFEQMPQLYGHFTEKLKAKGWCYQGLAYRTVAAELEAYIEELREQHRHYFFLGFNALNAAEERIMQKMNEEALATFIWDIDRYYWEDEDQEAGQFLRQSPLVKTLQEQGRFFGLHNSFKEEAKKIRLLSVSGNQLQAVLANLILQEEQAGAAWEQTALVLADEALLPAVLNNLSKEIPHLNVTMGLALEHSPLASFFGILLQMRKALEKKPRFDQKEGGKFYHAWWDGLLSNVICKRLFPRDSSVEQVRLEMRKRNLVAASYQQLQDLGLPKVLPEAFFQADLSPATCFQAMATFCEKLREKGLIQEEEALFGFYQLFNQLHALLEQYPYVKDYETAGQFYQSALTEVSIDLIGEPLQGLQVMGVLETRLLDFDRVLMLSVNEEVLPQGASDSSLIPHDVKKEYGLPTFLEKDAVYAYHFYRLLQRCQKADVIFNVAAGGFTLAEPSRFVRQVAIELPRYNRKIEVQQHSISGTAELPKEPEERIEKTEAIMKRLWQMAEKGFSPTALRDYLKDPLLFYYRRVLAWSEREEVLEQMDLAEQGTALHEILEEGYGKAEGKGSATRPYPYDERLPFFNFSRQELEERVAEKLRGQVTEGRNVLIAETMTRMLEEFQRVEIRRLKKLQKEGKTIALQGLEQAVEREIQLSKGQRVKVRGTVDRIQKVDEELLIIDYKTGGDKGADYRLKSLEDLESKPKAIQLLLYTWLYLGAEDPTPAAAAVYNLRVPRQGALHLTWDKKKKLTAEDRQIFEDYLRTLLEEILDPTKPFEGKS